MNPYEEAAQSMMQAGIGSLSGNTINKPPLFDPRENYIRETHDLNSPTNVINRKIQDFNNLKKSYEGTGMVPQTFPNWVIQDPDASGMMNTWGRYNKGSMFGTPMWMDAGITNSNLGGAKVWNALSADPTADDFFLRELYNYGKRYLPGYDAEQDEWRQKRYIDSLEEMDIDDLLKEKRHPYKGAITPTPFISDKIFEPGLEADLKLQDVMDLYESLGLDLNTDRFIRKANKAGVQVAGMDDSLQYLQRQIDELDRDSPNYDDQLEMLINDMEMKYPWAMAIS